MVEHYNRTLENQLATYAQDHQRDWDLHLPLLLMSYCSDDEVYTCNVHVRARIECPLGSAFEKLSYLEYTERFQTSIATFNDFATEHQQRPVASE